MKTPRTLPSIYLAALTALTLGTATSGAQLPLQERDVICEIGNGLGDRMQHDGWVETLIQSKLADKKLTFRNMAIVGDTVANRPREQGFPKIEEYLTLSKADVIFVYFGYNESFAGEGGVAKFKADLGAMIDKYRGQQFNGKSAPRFVLFSPIAHENRKSPNLPNGAANNVNLALYTGAIKQVAEEKQVAFVDLFSTSQARYSAAKTPLTLNGVHPLPEGNRQIAEIIATAITGKPVASSPSLEPLRQAVLDKNWYWHNRYRAVDSNDIWGGRSGLKFVGGQTNAVVLQHEMAMLDVMTANRDPKIWAVASGSSHTVADANVPPPLTVVSNIGAPKEYITGEEGVAKLKVPEGYVVNLFADEKRFPQMANPVQMQVDTKGRLWAACWNTYPKWEPLKPMTDCLLILTDTNGDGVADKATEFAKVHNPLGFEFWNGGVIVTSQPDILFLKDTDGDDVADVRIVLFQGIGSADTHHAANNLIYGPDGGIYWQSGIFLQNAYEHPWGPAIHPKNSGMYRFDPRRHTIAFHAQNDPNPHGISFDRWGYHYANDGTGGNSFQVRPDGNGFKMHQLVNKEVRPVPADAIVSSANFPDDIQQDFLVLNTIGYLGVKRYQMHREGNENPKRGFGEVWGTPTPDFIKSEDKNFRPTDAVFGEDGALYLSDWQNAIIGHMQHNIRDPNRDHLHGRIYRIIYKDRPLQKKVAIDGQPIPALLENLKHPIDGVRHRTRVELSERDSKEVIAATDKWSKQFDPKKAEDGLPLLEALWLHQAHNVRDLPLLEALLASPDKHVAINAATVKHHWGPADPTKGRGQPLPDVNPNEPKIAVTVPAHLTGDAAKAYTLGAAVFVRDGHCATCHQPNGAGLVPTYPPLDASPWVTGSEERLIKLTLHGLWGPIEVKGVIYDSSKGVPPMTPFGALLNDEEMAGVLTYVRNSWSNKAAPVLPATVKKVREATKDRSVFWDPAELLKAHPLE